MRRRITVELADGKKVKCVLTKDNIKIKDSYKIKSKRDMEKILIDIWLADEDWHTRDRSTAEYVREWRSHNILYKIPLKYFKKHSGDCDLSNNESKFRLFVYAILGRF